MIVDTPGGRATSAAPAVPPAPAPTPDAPVDPALQIVRALRVQTADGVSEAVIRLRPEHLGDVRILLTVERGGVTAVVHAERADVRAHILANVDSLKECLASQGLRLDELTVREDGRKGDSRQPAQEQAPRRYRRPPARAFELAAEE